MNRKVKGLGVASHNTITLDQRFKLFEWCAKHKDDQGSFCQLSRKATNDLGFVVTANTLQNHWNVVNGARRPRPSVSTIDEKLSELETRITVIERHLFNSNHE